MFQNHGKNAPNFEIFARQDYRILNILPGRKLYPKMLEILSAERYLAQLFYINSNPITFVKKIHPVEFINVA